MDLIFGSTGATGYIGGDFLVDAVAAHADWEITCLVRNSDKGALIAKVFPSVRLAYGDLDSTTLIEEESSKADIVYRETSVLLNVDLTDLWQTLPIVTTCLPLKQSQEVLQGVKPRHPDTGSIPLVH